MKEIQSSKNDLIKSLKKLHKKKTRDEENRYLIEGFHLVEEAVQAGAELEMILFNQRGLGEWGTWLAENKAIQQYLVSDEVLKTLSDLPTPQGMMAVVKKGDHAKIRFQGKWLMLDRVQDPGNIGTIIRTADAAAFSGVILGEGSADLYSTKVLRSMQGSHFHLPVVHGELRELIRKFQEAGVSVYGTELNPAAVDYRKLPKAQDVVLLLGNEGQGVAADLLKITNKNTFIPIPGQAESLNVAIAAGILAYHFVD